MQKKRIGMNSIQRTGVALTLAWAGQVAGAESLDGWGGNGSGQLGTGPNPSVANSPVPVTALGNTVTTFAAGANNSLAISGGALYSWGANYDGQIGNGTTTASNVPVAISGFSSGVTAVAAGSYHCLIIKNGAVFGWGLNSTGQVGNGSTTIALSPVATSVLTSGVTAIAGGGHHSLAIRNGALYAWGYNDDGELGSGNTTTSTIPLANTVLTSGVTAISAGGGHNLAIRSGALYGWGLDNYGQLGNGTTTNSTLPIAISAFSTGVTAVSAGEDHSLVVKNGSVYAMGYNGDGELGTGSTGNSSTPVQVDPADLTNITSVVASYRSSYALSSNGSLWVWGDNSVEQLGLNSETTGFLTPQHLLAPAGYAFTGIDSGVLSQFALATVATIASLGDANGDGKVNISDLGILATNYGKTGTGLGGDFNGDGVVNIADLGILATHYGFGTSSSEPPLSEALQAVGFPSVPEPASLAALGALTIGSLRRRQTR